MLPRDATAGMPIEAYTEAIEEARVAAERDFGIVLRWIYDIPGEAGLPAADDTLGFALDHAPDALIGFGLGGPEIGVPRPQFTAALRRGPGRPGSTPYRTPGRRRDRRRCGRRCATSAPSGSGTARRRRRTPTCSRTWPPSRSRSRSARPPTSPPARWRSLAEHPITAFRDAGVVVTVNSDDPPMFNTTLNREYAIAADLLGLDEAGVADLARTAVRVSFLDDAGKRRLTDEIDAYAEQPVH